MKYNMMNVTFWFNEVDNFKEYRNLLDEELNEIFTPFNFTGVPINFDPTIPRIVSNTIGGHTSFNMSKVNVQLSVHFDGDFIDDFKKCYSYTKEKALKVFEILTNKCGLNILYSAVYVNFEHEESNPVDKIVNDLFSMNIDSTKLSEIGIRMSEILDDKYYYIYSVNDAKVISITKKFEQSSKPQNIIIPLIPEKEITVEKKVLAYAIEINDKYNYNVIDEYSSSHEILEDIMDKCAQKIRELIEK